MRDYSLFEFEVYGAGLKTQSVAEANLEYLEQSPQKLIVSPVPVNADVRLSLWHGHRFSKYEVYNISGVVVIHGSIAFEQNELIFDASMLSPGVYMLRVEGVDGSQIAKFVKK